VQAFLDRGADFVQARSLDALIAGMNELTDEPLLDPDRVRAEIGARDREVDNRYTKDLQLVAVRQARAYWPDRITRVAAPHRLTDPAAGPLVAVRLSVLTRKTLGGLNTDLDGRVLGPHGRPVPGLFAAGEVAGFGGGGMHGYRSLEGTFLGGCVFSGRVAGRSAAG
jgi:predicted oxidoreductase